MTTEQKLALLNLAAQLAQQELEGEERLTIDRITTVFRKLEKLIE